MTPKQGWFESNEDFEKRVAREADEQTIENVTGSTPSRGWLETDEDYLARIAEEANEHRIETYTGDAPSRNWLESEEDYRDRIAQEANERTVENATGNAPSKNWLESDDDYDVRVRREANEHTIDRATGSAPKQHWLEGAHDYRSRIAHEARLVRADARRYSNGGESYGDTGTGDAGSGGSSEAASLIPVVVGLGIVLLLLYLHYTWRQDVATEVHAERVQAAYGAAQKAAFFLPSKQVLPPALRSFNTCAHCNRFDKGRNQSGPPVVVWNSGIEEKSADSLGESPRCFLWFGNIATIEKHDVRRTVGDVWREDYYPYVTITTQTGLDGSTPPQYECSWITFQDDASRDGFVQIATVALANWRQRFLPALSTYSDGARTVPPAAPSADEPVIVLVQNLCPAPIQVALHYYDPRGAWRTAGWWVVSPHDTVRPDVNVSSASPQIFFYFKTTEPVDNLQWTSEPPGGQWTWSVYESAFNFMDGESPGLDGERSVAFFEDTIDSGSHRLSEAFSCDKRADP